jgi:hypothetical protein
MAGADLVAGRRARALDVGVGIYIVMVHHLFRVAIRPYAPPCEASVASKVRRYILSVSSAMRGQL